MNDVALFLEKAKKHWTPEREKKVTLGKRYPIKPSEGALLLRTIGILNDDASMSADNLRKYMQINHMIIKIEPFFLDLCKRFPVVNVLDCACGNSYLTFLLAWCFKNVWKHEAQIHGIDKNKKFIEKSIQKSIKLELSSTLNFSWLPLKDFVWEKEVRPHAVLALHACDTATDDALAFGAKHKADFIAVAPCCQAELAQKIGEQISDNLESPLLSIFKTPEFRRTISSDITDVMRMLLMRSVGYEVTVSEFVKHEHSGKNRLLTCVKRGNYLTEASLEYDKLKVLFANQGISLEESLKQG